MSVVGAVKFATKGEFAAAAAIAVGVQHAVLKISPWVRSSSVTILD